MGQVNLSLVTCVTCPPVMGRVNLSFGQVQRIVPNTVFCIINHYLISSSYIPYSNSLDDVSCGRAICSGCKQGKCSAKADFPSEQRMRHRNRRLALIYFFALVTVLTPFWHTIIFTVHCRISAKFPWCASKSRAVFRIVSGLHAMSECHLSFQQSLPTF